MMTQISSWKDKALFTPGPLTTSTSVKQTMLHDFGSRDADFIAVIKDVRQRLVSLCANPDLYTSILLQGSGTYGIEAVLSSVIPQDGKLLVLVNGAYGNRMVHIAETHHISTATILFPENSIPDVSALDHALEADPTITHVAVVHCETTTGIINPIELYGEICCKHHRIYIVDAMSSFGAYPIDMDTCGIDFLVSSANKCIEGVPGFSFVIARIETLQVTRGYARTLSLDLLSQWEGLERDGQFRFTPPTHAILAFHQALLELEQEGGIEARQQRYLENYHATLAAMDKMGFQPYVEEAYRGYIITSFHYLKNPKFKFQDFYERLSAKGFVIYPGKISHARCFRIGHIGRLNSQDVRALMSAMAQTLKEMGINKGL